MKKIRVFVGLEGTLAKFKKIKKIEDIFMDDYFKYICPYESMIEALKEEISKSLKETEENTIKQVKEINKTVQDLKMEIEAIKKTQTEGILEMENLGKRT